jgi:hypothetical protein
MNDILLLLTCLETNIKSGNTNIMQEEFIEIEVATNTIEEFTVYCMDGIAIASNNKRFLVLTYNTIDDVDELLNDTILISRYANNKPYKKATYGDVMIHNSKPIFNILKQ